MNIIFLQKSFDSLQTGKCIASFTVSEIIVPYSCFDSLQTGKCIASVQKQEQGKNDSIQFRFPSNGKVYSKRPHFKPSGAVAPEPQKHTRTALVFFTSNLVPKIAQTRVYTDLYAIFPKNGSKARHRLGSWAIYEVFAGDPPIAYMFISIPQIRKNVNFF